MSFFNLAEANRKGAEDFVRKYIEAMGYQPIRRRKMGMQWWDYDEIKSSPPKSWTDMLAINPDLKTLLKDADYEMRELEDVQIARYCTLKPEQVRQLNKVYIGYNPESGGYLCSIGPYKHSDSRKTLEEARGKDNVIPRGSAVEEAWDKFYYYTLRRNKPTAAGVAKTVNGILAKYMENFGIELSPADFYLSYSETIDKKDAEAIYKSYAHGAGGTFADLSDVVSATEDEVEIEVAEVGNAAPENPKLKAFLQFVNDRPLPEKGNVWIRPNSKGVEKIIKERGLGPWWKQALDDKARQEKKTIQQVYSEMMTSPEIIEGLYNMMADKYAAAKRNKDPMLAGVLPPPPYSKMSGQSGQRVFTSVETTKSMAKLLQFRLEIAEAMNKGVTDPSAIANIINSHPDRARKIKREHLNPISAQAVEKQMSLIEEGKGEKDMGTFIKEQTGNKVYMESARGYDDLKTAFEMGVAFLASQTEETDPLTGAPIGDVPSVLGNLPENFTNYTSQDLKALREACVQDRFNKQVAQETEEKMDPKKLEKKIKKDIGKELPPEVKPQETEVVPPGVEPVVEPGKTPKKVPQTSKKPPQKAPVSKAPAKAPQPKKRVKQQDVVGYTLRNLIKIASELDDEGKEDAAEEVHKIIRKYQERL